MRFGLPVFLTVGLLAGGLAAALSGRPPADCLAAEIRVPLLLDAQTES